MTSTARASGKKTSAKAFRDQVRAQFYPDWKVPNRKDQYSLGSKDFAPRRRTAKKVSTEALGKLFKKEYDPRFVDKQKLVRIPLGLPNGQRIGKNIVLKGFTRVGQPLKLNVILDGGRNSLPIFLPCDLYEQRIVDFADSLKERLLAKYRKGRKQHGGAPTNVDCQAEVNQEVLDIINYFLIDKVNGNAKKA